MRILWFTNIPMPDVDRYYSKDANVKRGIGPDPTKPKSKKKKELRKEKALAKMLAAGKSEADYVAKNAAKNEAKTVEDLTSLEFPSDRLVNTISWANKEPFFWVNWLQFVANILFRVWGLHKINIDTQTKVV